MSKSLVFISWSGDRAKAVAKALVDWLPLMLQSVDPWCSDSTDAGKSWGTEITNKLSAAKVGIIVVTPENRERPWLLFEAGAIAKTLPASPEDTRAIPYLFDLETKDISPPISLLQAKLADEDGTKKIVESVNRTLQEPLSDVRLDAVFAQMWPLLQVKLAAAKVMEHGDKAVKKRSDTDVLAEVLDTVRRLERGPQPGPLILARMARADLDRATVERAHADQERQRAVAAWGRAQEGGDPSAIEECRVMVDVATERSHVKAAEQHAAMMHYQLNYEGRLMTSLEAAYKYP